MDHWTEEEVYRRLDEKMAQAYQSVFDFTRKYSVTMRQAAYSIAVERVVKAMEARGWV
jgi:glutamate dehydrogenase (NAD(P)+)